MITQADKGKPLVIVYKQEYNNKVHTFLTDNKFQAIPNNPTNKYQKQITQAIKQSNLIFNKEKSQTPNPMKPSATHTKSPTKTSQSR